MRNLFLTAIAGIALSLGSAHAQEVIIRTRPPRPLAEHRIARPGRDHIWIKGYHRWNGNAYVWEPGRWERPPRPRAVWVAPRWEHRRGGWIFVEGRWR